MGLSQLLRGPGLLLKALSIASEREPGLLAHPMPFLTIVLLALACARQVAVPAPAANQGTSTSTDEEAPVAVPWPAPNGAQVSEDHYVIEQVAVDAQGDLWQLLDDSPRRAEGAQVPPTPPREVGLLLWRRWELDGERLLEWDARFPGDHTRILHVERRDAAGTSLVFREMRPQSGRTLSADRIDDGRALRLREWSGPRGLQERLPAGSGELFPLELLESLRDEAHAPLAVRRFDPLSRSFEDLEVRTQRGGETTAHAGERLIELRRADGSQVGAYLLNGSRVLAFQWQAGNLRLRRIDAEEHARRLAANLVAPSEQ